MTAAAALNDLLRQTRAMVASRAMLSGFVADGLDGLALNCPRPRSLPAASQLADCAGQTSPETEALTRAILAAAPHAHWQQSYSEAQVGAEHLARYGWFNLVSPGGPFRSDALRVSVGYWGKGLCYPRHRHVPEEIYCVLAGGARFETDGRDPVEAGPGVLIHHPSNIWHGMAMDRAPLLVMAFWRGSGLVAASQLEDDA